MDNETTAPADQTPVFDTPVTQVRVVQDRPGLKAVVQIVLVVAGVGVIWMLGSSTMNYDPETRTQVITLLGSLAAYASAATLPRK